MQNLFQAIFTVAAIGELVIVAIACFQLWRNRNREITVLSPRDALYGAAFFGAAAILTAFIARDARMDGDDVLVYAAAFGIVAAALSTFVRRRASWPARYARLALLLPLGFGVFAGLAAPL
ncbi:hypothetical protein ACFVMC_23180 [Nocardia sp. NPDC127579]|uniref:hypothetical protein n=1 Tax=Nocardia sp. NPDC127579 TaxID=3345402 RepID=UPI003633BA7D